MKSIKVRVCEALKKKYEAEDIRLVAFGIPYGYWVWDEAERTHVQLKTHELDQELRDRLSQATLSKEEIFADNPTEVAPGGRTVPDVPRTEEPVMPKRRMYTFGAPRTMTLSEVASRNEVNDGVRGSLAKIEKDVVLSENRRAAHEIESTIRDYVLPDGVIRFLEQKKAWLDTHPSAPHAGRDLRLLLWRIVREALKKLSQAGCGDRTVRAISRTEEPTMQMPTFISYLFFAATALMLAGFVLRIAGRKLKSLGRKLERRK